MPAHGFPGRLCRGRCGGGHRALAVGDPAAERHDRAARVSEQDPQRRVALHQQLPDPFGEVVRLVPPLIGSATAL